jgi:hypothetical protein
LVLVEVVLAEVLAAGLRGAVDLRRADEEREVILFEPVYAFQPGRWGQPGEIGTSTIKRALIAIGESAPIRDR